MIIGAGNGAGKDRTDGAGSVSVVIIGEVRIPGLIIAWSVALPEVLPSKLSPGEPYALTGGVTGVSLG